MKSVVRVGWGTEFHGKPGNFTWFHVAIPTPTITDNVRVSLEKIFILYKTIDDNQTTLFAVHPAASAAYHCS